MPVNTSAVGKRFPTDVYAVGREKIREYAAAVGETNALHHDLDAARAAGHADLVAPPMFVVVYAGRAVIPALFDPEVGIDFARMVHGAQEFVWNGLVIAGDELTTTAQLISAEEKTGLGFYVFESKSTNQRDELVVTGTWTNIVRGAE
jgi:acyl dehydratase